MESPAQRGQVLTELLWTVILVSSFAIFLLRLHHAMTEEQRRPRWEIQRGVDRPEAK